MSENFLSTFMRSVHEVTDAERAFTVLADLTVVDAINILPQEIDSRYLSTAQKAMKDGKAVMTDNYTILVSPEKVPDTNRSYPSLRAVIMVPVAKHGVVCLDRRVTVGIINKEAVTKLERLAQHFVANPTLTQGELVQIYRDSDF